MSHICQAINSTECSIDGWQVPTLRQSKVDGSDQKGAFESGMKWQSIDKRIITCLSIVISGDVLKGPAADVESQSKSWDSVQNHHI